MLYHAVTVLPFALAGAAAGVPAPTVLPTEQSTLNHVHVQFAWLPVPAVDDYELLVVEDDGSPDPFDGATPVVDMIVAPDEPTVIVKAGLAFGASYAWHVRGNSGDPLPWGDTHRFSTAALPDYMPDMLVASALGPTQPGLTMFDVIFADPPPAQEGLAVAVDEAGNPVWFLTRPGRIADLRLLDNGRVLFTEELDVYYGFETTLQGDQTWASPIGLHHEVFPMPNGDILGLTFEFQEVMVEGQPQTWVGDEIVEIDRATNDIVASWSTFDHYSTLDFDPTVMAQPLDGTDLYDWTHCNAVVYNPSDNSVYLSVRHLSRITRIDYATGNIVYNMGFDMPSGETDFGDNLFSFQHAIEVLPDGNMMVYDNGNRRDHIDQTPATGMTKAIELSFSGGEPPTAASIDWTWTQPVYSPYVGDADRLPNGNTLVVAGPQATIYEVDPAGSEVWSLQAVGTTYPVLLFYRAERIDDIVVANTCPEDLVDPAGVGIEDFLKLLASWGQVGVPADFLPPAGVGIEDFLTLLQSWGPCS